MTESGMSLGTPHYMSPEQAMGERDITPRSDVYALGCITYEMLVGERPFTEARSLDSLHAVPARTRIPPLTGRQPELPSSLDSVFARAFSLDPAERPSGALVLMGNLEQAIGG